MLQEGIYWESTPAPTFALAMLAINPEANAAQIGSVLEQVWAVIQSVKAGNIPDLPGHPVERRDTTVLISYGYDVFALEGVRHDRPNRLNPDFQYRNPEQNGGGTLLRGSGLAYGEDVLKNKAAEGIALQIIGATELDVHQVIVEIWKALEGAQHDFDEKVLTLNASYRGFHRVDRRTWIDFHDGISNLRKGDERLRTIAIKSDAETWTQGGSYLCFIRLAVNLEIWRKFSRKEQELFVGRDKLTGCPLVDIADDGSLTAIAGCPIARTSEVIDRGNNVFREPPSIGNIKLNRSHVQRSNREHKTDFEREDSLRIYRQGYDFYEPTETAPGFIVGLNFVSFMDTPRRLLRILTQDGWLGGINFGGDVNDQPHEIDRLLSVRAAGNFLAPPIVEGELFPGSSIFI